MSESKSDNVEIVLWSNRSGNGAVSREAIEHVTAVDGVVSLLLSQQQQLFCLAAAGAGAAAMN